MNSNKSGLRRKLRQQRDALDRRAERSRQLTAAVTTWEPFQRARAVALYVSFRSEVQTDELLQRAWNAGQQVSLPVCREHTLELFRVDNVNDLHAGKFGIAEPSPVVQAEPGRAVEIRDVDLILVPGLGFDRQGNRMGYGRGYYDRLLADAPPSLLRCGLAFDVQLIDAVPAEAHDIPLDYVLTESRFWRCERFDDLTES